MEHFEKEALQKTPKTRKSGSVT